MANTDPLQDIDNFEGKQLKTFRNKLKLTQVQFCEETKINQSDLSKYENGSYQVPLDLIKTMHKLYKMNYKWYFHREMPMIDDDPEPKKLTMDVVIKLKEDNEILFEMVKKLERDVRFLASKL